MEAAKSSILLSFLIWYKLEQWDNTRNCVLVNSFLRTEWPQYCRPQLNKNGNINLVGFKQNNFYEAPLHGKLLKKDRCMLTHWQWWIRIYLLFMFLYIMHGLAELPPLLQYSHCSERPRVSGGWVFQETVFLFSGANSSRFHFEHHATGHLYIITDYDPCIEWKAAEYSNWWLWKWNKQQKNKNSNAVQKTNSKQLYHFMPSKVGSSLCG